MANAAAAGNQGAVIDNGQAIGQGAVPESAERRHRELVQQLNDDHDWAVGIIKEPHAGKEYFICSHRECPKPIWSTDEVPCPTTKRAPNEPKYARTYHVKHYHEGLEQISAQPGRLKDGRQELNVAELERKDPLRNVDAHRVPLVVRTHPYVWLTILEYAPDTLVVVPFR